MRTLKAGVSYFALMFGAGFVLGVVRVLLIAPRIGERMAELAEIPLMVIVVAYFAARWTVRRFAIPPIFSERVGVGLIALALMLVCEFGVVLGLRGMTLDQYFTIRDPVSGAAYYIGLLLFALMPSLLLLR